MNTNFIILVCALLASCRSFPVEEESVVSVYTTQPTTSGTHIPLDVYHQFANNLAEKIKIPIYRFLGYNSTTAPATTTKKPWPRLEVLDDKDLTTNKELTPVNNDIEKTRDVEELSPDKTIPEKKPEKITLYSSLAATYLPTKLVTNDSLDKHNEVDFDDSLDLDDVDMVQQPFKGRQGPFIYVLEFIGSVFQLLWGGLQSIFKS